MNAISCNTTYIFLFCFVRKETRKFHFQLQQKHDLSERNAPDSLTKSRAYILNWETDKTCTRYVRINNLLTKNEHRLNTKLKSQSNKKKWKKSQEEIFQHE